MTLDARLERLLRGSAGWPRLGRERRNFSYFTPDGFSGSPSFITNSYGVLAGAHVGYNWQFDHWVLGLEGSVDVTDLNKREQLGCRATRIRTPTTPSLATHSAASAPAAARSTPISVGHPRVVARPRWLRLEPSSPLWNRWLGGHEFQSSVQHWRTGRLRQLLLCRRERSLGDAPRLDWRRGRRICDHASLVGARGISLLRLRPYRGDAHLLLDDGALLRGRLPRHAAAGSSRGQL